MSARSGIVAAKWRPHACMVPLIMFSVLAAGPVQARPHHLARRTQTHRAVRQDGVEAPIYIYHSPAPCYSRDDCDRKDYDESGTRGRMGLGASPYHPEGPGNATD